MSANYGSGALPLKRAAEVLGLSADALRMRFRRGKVQGFRRGRSVFIYVNEQTSGFGENVVRNRSEPTPGGDAGLAPIVELQRVELTRLLRDNRRLNERLDRALKHQEQEQVLRLHMQRTLDSLVRSALGGGETVGGEETVGGGAKLEGHPAEARDRRLDAAMARLDRVIGRNRGEDK